MSKQYLRFLFLKRGIRRGMLSSALALIFLAFITVMLLASMLEAYEVSIREIYRSVVEGKEIIADSMKEVSVTASGNCSILMYPNQGSIRALDIVLLHIREDGTIETHVIKKNVFVNHPTVLLNTSLTKQIIDNPNTSLLVLLDNGNYVKLNSYDVMRLCSVNGSSASPTNLVGGYSSNDNVLLSVYGRGPYVVAGYLINGRSLLEEPIPGSVLDPGANFVPEVYVKLSGNIPPNVIGNRLKVTRRGDSYSFTFYKVNQGFMLLIPVLLSRQNTSIIRFNISIKLTPLLRAYNLGDYWVWFDVWFNFRPAVYAVLPEDYVRTPLVTIASAVMLGAQFKNSVARAIYWSYGTARTLYAYSYSLHGVVTDSGSVVISVNPREVFRNIPNTVNSVVVLAGLFGYITWDYEYGGQFNVNEYAMLTISIHKLS